MPINSDASAVNGTGHTDYGENVVNRLKKEEEVEKATVRKLSKEHDIVLKTFRLLIADLCQQFNGGHPGGAIGMAAIGIALWKYVMRYAPHTPDYFNRDRFILSNGYKAMTFDQLKSYHSDRVDALCPGHPEIEHEGIEVTTGPLGQGVANAVGLAMATKNLQATYNKPEFDVVSNHTWCMIGDACLQEGVALEAISFAGHLKLNNLTIIYDNNQITCDGSVDLTNTEDVNAKMRACGWDVIDIEDGCFDIDGLVEALNKARASINQPTFINVRTVIGLGSAVAGNAVAHGAAFGSTDVTNMKKMYDFNPEEHFVVGEEARKFFEPLPARGQEFVHAWDRKVQEYEAKYPELGAEFRRRVEGRLPENWKQLIPSSFPDKPAATRASSGLVFNPIAQACDNFMVGTADLSPSVNMSWKGKVDFQNPNLKTACGIAGNYSGRYIHYGVREHAMAAISNGLAAFAPNTFVPITSSFFMFYLYAAPAVRMGALQRLQVIHAATHDSIGMGEDGPTHQPIELANLYRSMPNILYIRPGDSEETAGAWITAIEAKNTPTIISTSRHALPQLPQTRRDGVASGAYVLEEAEDADVTLIGVGAELTFAVDVAKELRARNVKARVVSFPCWRLFEAQSREYKRETLRKHRVPAVVIEPYAPNGWERYANAAICVKRFGHSLPGKAAYKYFGFEVGPMTEKIERYMESIRADEILRQEFVEL
ncbi:dihydroxyacetone synthase [Massarina eburnea CBS 473.64]|uniref:transketolase n=1 Tax=Massarina eburnea CBS 473.64 TaxID=1395130 RepID=A0A6A6SBE7_9PLEO|nr:dihydroxyacetone synthase [Massarina eburnea CBS 473.64]